MVQTRQDRFGQFFIHLFMLVIAAICVVPLLTIVSTSFSKESDIANFGYSLIPRHFDTTGYDLILKNPGPLLNAYGVSALMTLFGTILGTAVAALCAWPLSRPDYPYRKVLSFVVMFTMLFSGGMIPSYLVTTMVFHLKDNFLVLVLPYLANAWYIFLLRTFFQNVPMSLVEAARIDGASEFLTFQKIIVPLAKPALATVALFYALQYWNDWYLALLYINSEQLVPLQYMLSRMMSNIDFISQNVSILPPGLDLSSLPKQSARMAMCLLAVGPMFFVFGYFQKYFVRGITLGAVKG